jgi:predicted permease
MRSMTKLRLRLRSLLRGARLDQDLHDELGYHLERLTEQYLARGLSRSDARDAARREMGGVDQQKEACRDARGLAFVDSLRQDARYALRALRRHPGFSAVAILSLAVGIGANTTIFSFVNAVLLRPLPYPGSERMVVLREQPLASVTTVSVHPLNFVEWRSRARAFEAMALVQTPPLDLMDPNGAVQLARAQTTADLFRVFGLGPALGRSFTEEETRPGQHPVVILGHSFWQQRFAGDPGVLGRSLPVRDGALTIIGVAPAGIRLGLIEPDVYTPLTIDAANPGATGSRAFQCYARLKPGLDLDAVRAEMSGIAGVLAREHRIDEGMGASVSSLHESLVRDGRPALRLLMAVVAVVLLIACVNLAGLLMARGVGRRGELALRASLGASRGRLVRQLVIESLVLALLGGAGGLVLAYWATDALAGLTAGTLTGGRAEPIRLDSACLVFTLGLSTLTALVFGLLPAWQAGRIEPESALRAQGSRSTPGRRQQRVRSALIVAEVALAVVLLVGAGLLLRTFSNLVHVDLGFQTGETVTMGLFLGVRPPEARVAAVDQILERVEAVPGVKAASTIQFLPLSGATCGSGFWMEGQTGDENRSLPTDCSLVSRGYFAAMGIPILEGRPFERRDTLTSPRVAVVNRAFARRYFPDGRAIGHRIVVHQSNKPPAEIVGVSGDIRHNGLMSEPAPTVFLSHAQSPGYIFSLVVRTIGDPGLQATAIRQAIRDVDPSQAVSRVTTMAQYLDAALSRPRMYAALVGSFAAVAALLAAIGLYGLAAYIVTQRTHEIGVRFALGAPRKRVFLDVFGLGARLVLAGLALGIVAAAALRGVLSTLLFGVDPGDVVVYGIAAAFFAVAALAVVAVPARRASRVDAMTALRHE